MIFSFHIFTCRPQYSAITLRRKETRAEATNHVRTQMTEWLNQVLHPTPAFESTSLVQSLSSGVVLCELALAISEKAISPLGKIHMSAQPGSILAHENVKAYLRAAVVLGMDPRELFDPSCLVSSASSTQDEAERVRNEREVVYSLLSFALMAHTRYGVVAPRLKGADTINDTTLAQCLNAAVSHAQALGSSIDVLNAVGLGTGPDSANSPSNSGNNHGQEKNITDVNGEEEKTKINQSPEQEEKARKDKEREERRIAELTAKQEFFFLTALAVKMTHELREDVCVVSSEELWQKVIYL